MSSRLLTSALMRVASSRDRLRAISAARAASGGFVSASDSARPTSAASGVRRSCESAESSELRSRSDSICISACCATST